MANDQTQQRNQDENRRDEVGGSGVHPASAHDAPADSEIRTENAWGQGERGAAGYDDSGRSELHPTQPARDRESRQERKEER